MHGQKTQGKKRQKQILTRNNSTLSREIIMQPHNGFDPMMKRLSSKNSCFMTSDNTAINDEIPSLCANYVKKTNLKFNK